MVVWAYDPAYESDSYVLGRYLSVVADGGKLRVVYVRSDGTVGNRLHDAVKIRLDSPSTI